MTRWLVRFGYDGLPFHGWARQPGALTVQGEIEAGLDRRAITGPGGPVRVEVASRTDRGVSARANALVLDSPLAGIPLLRALNGIRPEIRFTAATEVAPTFRVRAAVRREYRYFLAPGTPRLDRWPRVLEQFRGRPLDARSFGRALPLDRPAWRTLEEIELVRGEPASYLRLTAPGFVWGMVRKIVTAIDSVTAGELSPTELAAAIRGDERLALSLAPPEPLVLWEVVYSQPWQHSWERLTRQQARYVALEQMRAGTRPSILDAWMGGAAPA